MPRGKKFAAERIIGKLREAEVGLARGKNVPEVVRKPGVTEQIYYRWKREYGGLQMDQAKRLSDPFVRKGVPDHIRSDNGSEFTAIRVREWLELAGVKTLSIEPGLPWENGSVESFDGKLRDDFLDREVFDTLLGSKVLIERWRKSYNTVRAYSSLRDCPPAPESRRPRPIASAKPQQPDGGEPLAGQPR